MSMRLKKIIDETRTPEELNYFDYEFDTFNGEKIKIKIKKELTLSERNGFIDQCVDVVFRDGVYHPQDRELGIALSTLKYYTDVELVDKDGKPTIDDETIYEFSKSKMMNELSRALPNFTELVLQTKEYIDSIVKDIQIYKSREIDDLISSVNSLTDNMSYFSEVIKGLDESKVKTALDKFANMNMKEITEQIVKSDE